MKRAARAKSGMMRLNTSRLVGIGARYYDARIGRFLSVDPLSDDERLIGWSPYHYGYNSPIVYIDPNGMRPQFEEDDEEDDKKVNEVSDADDDTESDTTIQNEKEKIVKSASVLLTVAGTSFYIQQKYVKKILKFMQEQQDVLRKHKLESLKNAKIMAQANKHKNIIRWATKASPIASGLLSYFEFSQNKDPVQLTINMSIIGITIVKPPLGLALGVLDHTIGIKRIGNAHIETQMKILEYNEGRPPAGLGRR